MAYKSLDFAMLMSPNKGETAVHGCHCPGDMVVRMRTVLAIPRGWYVCLSADKCCLILTLTWLNFAGAFSFWTIPPEWEYTEYTEYSYSFGTYSVLGMSRIMFHLFFR